MQFNPSLKVTTSDAKGNSNTITIVDVAHTWIDSPGASRLLAQLPGLPTPVPVFVGNAYTTDWTEEQAVAQLQTMADGGAINAFFNPVPRPAPAPGSIVPPAPVPGAAKAAAAATPAASTSTQA